MRNFVFHNPTKVIFGRGTIGQIGKETAAFGEKALLVYGRGSIKTNGVYDQVRDSLAEAGITVVEHGGVRPNPVLGHVRQGIALARQHRVEAVLAAGGGSVMDSAKAIAAGVLVEHDVWKFFTGKKSITAVLPLLCVATLAASGSEMNPGMVLTNEEQAEKFGFANRLLHPRVSILDPTATFSVPADYTAYGAVDSLTHVLEFYFNAEEQDSPVQDRYIEGLAINIMASCELALADLHDYQGRADLMWCAALALNGLAAAGLGKVGFPMHLIEHSLSALFDTPHGAGLAVIMPAWMKHKAEEAPSRFAQFAERIFGVAGGSDQERAVEGISRLTAWLANVKCPLRLADIGIAAGEIPRIASHAQAQARTWRIRDYPPERIEAILRTSL